MQYLFLANYFNCLKTLYRPLVIETPNHIIYFDYNYSN